MRDDISLLEIVDQAGFEASIITTFNATLPFYEEVVLRRLRANGCRSNTVLMDSSQLAVSFATEATRPRQAGYDYSLIPIRTTGAFHPKVAIFVGQKKASVFVGSHNLTVAGFGYNRELTNLIEMVGTKQSDSGRTLRDVWGAVHSWVTGAAQYLPEPVIQSALAMQKQLKPFVTDDNEQSAFAFVTQAPGTRSLFDQLLQSVDFEVKGGTIIGAFFDHQLLFLKALRSKWPSATFTIGIDPETVHLPVVLDDERINFVDIRAVWPETSERYLHAKAVYLEAEDGRSFFMSGSANPSGPGWGLVSGTSNVEAMMIQRGLDATKAFRKIGLDKLSALPTLARDVLDTTTARAKAIKRLSASDSISILVAEADDANRTISIPSQIDLYKVTVEALDENDASMLLECSASMTSLGTMLTFSESVSNVRTLLLNEAGKVFSRVVVHHTAAINSFSGSSKQHQIRVALGQLGSGGTDISKLINQVSEVIFASDVSTHAIQPRRSNEQPSEVSRRERPSSLAMSIADMTKQRRKKKLIDGGDLGYLLDILIQKLHIPNPSAPVPIPDAQAGNPEDGSDDDPTPGTDAPIFDDTAIAEAVHRKATSLINKMIKREELAAAEPGRVTEMLAQLIAVIAILKELKHLETQGRWSNKKLQLVDQKYLERLMTSSMYHLFSSEHGLWSYVESEEDIFEELGSLNVLLSWLAWQVGYDFTPRLPQAWQRDRVERDFLFIGNAYIGKLFPRLILDQLAKPLELALHSTIEAVPKQKALASSWLSRNLSLGNNLLTGFSVSSTDRSAKSVVGSFAYVPNKIDPWAVVLDVDDRLVRIWDFETGGKDGIVSKGFLKQVVLSYEAHSV